MAQAQVIDFVLKDREGEEHHYVCIPHPPSDGFKVLDAMTTLGIGGLVQVLFASTTMGSGADGEVSTKTDLKRLMSGFSAGDLASSIQGGIKASGGLAVLAPMLLKHTTRDTMRLDAAGIELSFKANYGELAAALRKVVDANGFFELLAGFFTDAS